MGIQYLIVGKSINKCWKCGPAAQKKKINTALTISNIYNVMKYFCQVLEDGKLTLKHTLCGHQHAVSFVAWSPDDTKLLTCGNTEVLKPWDVETGTCKHTFGNQGFVVSSCAWFPNSKQFGCGSSDPEKGVCMWDCDGNVIKSWIGMRMPKVVDLAVTPDGEYLISIFMDKEIRILHMGTSAEQVISEEHPITSLSVSGDSKFFIVNLNSQEIHMWDVAGKWDKPLRFMGHKQHKYVIRSCFGGLNNTFIASGCENSQVVPFSLCPYIDIPYSLLTCFTRHCYC